MGVESLASRKHFSFELVPPFDDGLSASVVNVVGRDVSQGFVVALGVVVIDESCDRFFKLLGRLPDRQVDPLLARAMIAFDLAVGLRMIR